MLIHVADLKVGQNRIRDADQIAPMIDFVESGGLWTKDRLSEHGEANLIAIAIFEDGAQMIHDGHHRIVATFLAGRGQLEPEEYFTYDLPYKEYRRPNLDTHWYTPFDPLTEVRRHDFFDWRQQAIDLARVDRVAALEFIARGRSVYTEKRQIHTVAELASTYTLLRNFP